MLELFSLRTDRTYQRAISSGLIVISFQEISQESFFIVNRERLSLESITINAYLAIGIPRDSSLDV